MATSSGRLPAILLLALLAATGCGRSAPPATGGVVLRDDAGRTVRLARPAGRVVALIPSLNELIVAMGAQDRLIARSDYDREPALASLPSIGGGLTPNIEWLAAQHPDLVFAWPDEHSRAVVDRLAAVGVPVYSARIETLADADRTTRALGQLLGLQGQALALIGRVHTLLDNVRHKAAGLPRPRVLYLIGLDPPEVAASGTFVDELLGMAGGRNIFGDLKLWPTVSLEEAVRRQPDVVIVAVYGQTGDAAAHLRSSPGWSALAAVRAGRVVALDPFVANRPGPHAGEVAEELFRALHPAAAQAPGRALRPGGSGGQALASEGERGGA
ncbi:MAG TPA: helical backbone metal receptor, partial [Longimicrobiales bacterium]